MNLLHAFGLGIAATAGASSFVVYFLPTDRAKAAFGGYFVVVCGVGALLVAFG